MDKMKIIFVGTPDMALICLENMLQAQFNIVGVVPPKKTHETYPYFKNFVRLKGLNLLDFQNSPNEEAYIEKIKALNADIGVVCSYNTLLSKDFLSSAKMGYINCHPSLLPDYRGAMPYFHIVKNGEDMSGVTLHFMDEEFDTGDIVYQKRFKLLPWETMGTIFNRTNYMLSEGLIETLNKIQSGQNIPRNKQQKEGNFKQAPRVESNFRINWNKSAEEIERLIRACNPFFNVYTTFRQTNVKIIKARAIEAHHELAFGQIALVESNRLLVAAKESYLSIEILQVGTWGIFNVNEFFCTFTPTIDEVFK